MNQIISETMNIIVSQEIEQVCPGFVGACVEAEVVNTPYSEGLWQEIKALGERLRQELTTETLKELSGIAATRRALQSMWQRSVTLPSCFGSPYP